MIDKIPKILYNGPLDREKIMNHLDIYRWSYKDSYLKSKNELYPYWCCTRIAVVIESESKKELVDTYWGWPPDRMFSDGRKWTPEKSEEILDLEFVANLNDLELLTDTPEWYDNVIDLTHANTSINLRFIRKGQQRSISAQIRDYEDQITVLKASIDYRTYKLKNLEQELLKLQESHE